MSETKLTLRDGERMLWHAFEHVREGNVQWIWQPEEILDETVRTIHDCLDMNLEAQYGHGR